MSLIRRARRSAVLLAVGAAVGYFFDPVEGDARRRAVTDRLRGLARTAGVAPDADGRRDPGSGPSRGSSGRVPVIDAPDVVPGAVADTPLGMAPAPPLRH